MRLVVIESPLRGDHLARNVMYADALMLDALLRGEAPYLGHLLYPRVLNDDSDVHRAAGIAAHCAWIRRADAVVVGTDHGITDGMQKAIALAQSIHVPVEHRQLGADWQARFLAEAQETPGFFS